MFDKIKKVYNKAVSAIKDKVEDIKQSDADQELLSKWQAKLEDAMQDHNTFRSKCAYNDEQYNGSRDTSGTTSKRPMSNKDVAVTKDAKQVVNITFQLIESQIDITVPQPRVDELEKDDVDRKKMIEGKLKQFAESDEAKVIVAENERITKKNSYSIMKVCYDPDFDGHTYKGRTKVVNPHPVNVIFQKNCYRIKDMNHLWHIENRDIDNVCAEYGEEFRDELEIDGAKYNYLEDLSGTTSRESTSKNMLSVVETWYKDKEGDVNLFTWCNSVKLRHNKKFFYKKDLIQRDGKYYEIVSMEQYDEQGNIIGYQDVEVVAKVPKEFPFIIQYNIPKEKSIRGKSDPEVISDQQEAIKKVLSNEQERLLKGNTKIITRKGSGLANKINNSITQCLETENPTSDVYVIDMKTQDRQLKEFYNLMVSAAKDSLGVTDAGQGIIQNNQLSGRAIEQLSSNSTGRLAPKLFQKHIAFSQLYRKLYEFDIAFCDDKRPFKFGEGATKQYGYFNKSQLIKQDSAGEWYYPEFDITITTDSGIPKDPRFMLDFINGSGNRMDNVEYWTVAENIGITGASDILEMEKKKMEQIPPQPPTPTDQPPTEQMPPEQPQAPQGDIMDEVIKGLTPEELAAVEANPELLQKIIAEHQGGGQVG
jgi:hypothetical protein